MACQSPDYGGGDTGRDQREPEQGGGSLTQQGSERLVGRFQFRHLLVARVVEGRGGHGHHGQVDEAGDGHGDGHIDPGAVQPLGHAALILGVLGQRRVEIDDVGHHCRPQHAGGEIDGIAVGQAGEEGAFQQAGQMGAGEDQLDYVGGGHEQQQTSHHELQRLLAAGLQHENAPGDHGSDAGPFQQRHPEQQLEAHSCADELGEIRGHGDDLRLHPVGPDCRFG